MADLKGSEIVDYFAQIAPYVNDIIPGDIGVTIAKDYKYTLIAFDKFLNSFFIKMPIF